MKVESEKDAIAAYMASRPFGVPKGYSVAATCLVDFSFLLEDGARLWSIQVVPEDEAQIRIPGTATIVGPDGKVWTYVANPTVYDDEILKVVLIHLYLERVADLVDPDSLFERVEFMTRQRDEAIVSFLDEARRGELRGRGPVQKGH